MVTRDKRVDAYIEKAPEFARPILVELRARVHAACPDAVETLKWRMPSFEYKGILCGMAAFKKHAVFGFWKHNLVVADDTKANMAMGSFGKLVELEQLPKKAEFARLMKKAMKLNDDGVKVVRNKTAKKKPITMHPEFKKALAGNAKARAQFEEFAPSKQREYMEWISDAKADETRERRLMDAIAWIAQGKSRNWKYMNC
jgi:uncharacterized protein YdeI (YjbR/CyaY-like superfamily)